MNAPVLRALVVAGGRSRRMGRDKANLRYHETPQVRWTADLCAEVCDQVAISCRPEQVFEDLPESTYPRIHDRIADKGPLGGLDAAHAFDPDTAWLVVACDLPALDATTLRTLVDRRDPEAGFTAFRSAVDGRPEPLCAIYEPAVLERVAQQIRDDRLCARRFLEEQAPLGLLLDLPGANTLDNVNTPEEARSFGGLR